MHKIVLERPAVVRVVDGETTHRGPGEALVGLRKAGICGSDLSAYRGTSPLVTYPRVLGHELLVDVLECPEMPKLEGRRAVVDPMVRCGHCRACRSGRYNCCATLKVMGVHLDGGLQERFPLSLERLFPVPDTLPDDAAVLAEPLTIAYHAVQRAAISAGSTAVVLGAGAIGLLIAQVLMRARGCHVLVVDVVAQRLRVAEALGATALQGDVLSLREAIGRATNGEMADVVFEATGNPGCTRMTTELVGHGGRIVLIGWNQGPVEVDTVTLMRKEVDVLGSRCSCNAFGAATQLLADGVIAVDVMITHRYSMDDAGEALRKLDSGDGATLKILIDGGA